MQWAFLEFSVDVASRRSEGLQSETPLFEVYALKSAFSGEVDPSQFQEQSLPTTRPLVAREDHVLLRRLVSIAPGAQRLAVTPG